MATKSTTDPRERAIRALQWRINEIGKTYRFANLAPKAIQQEITQIKEAISVLQSVTLDQLEHHRNIHQKRIEAYERDVKAIDPKFPKKTRAAILTTLREQHQRETMLKQQATLAFIDNYLTPQV